jgi:hypothetical protein
MKTLEDEIRALYKDTADLTDVVSILYSLLARIEVLEAKLEQQEGKCST